LLGVVGGFNPFEISSNRPRASSSNFVLVKGATRCRIIVTAVIRRSRFVIAPLPNRAVIAWISRVMIKDRFGFGVVWLGVCSGGGHVDGIDGTCTG